MDQPQQGDDDAVQNTNDGFDAPQQPDTDQQPTVEPNVNASETTSEVDSYSPPTEDTVSEVATNSPDTSSESFTPPASQSSETSVPSLETAEEQVAEAMPQSTADELAVVTAELETMGAEEETVPFDSGEPVAQPAANANTSYGGSDPMDQIMSDEASQAQPVNDMSGYNPAAESVPEASDDTPVEAQENQWSAPTEETSTDQSVAETSMVAEEAHDESFSEPMTDPSTETETANPEQSSPSSDPIETPLAVEPSEDLTPLVEDATIGSESDLESASAGNQGEMISDVIAPTAVATALAQGSSGENAITHTPESSTVESSQSAALDNQKAHSPKKSGAGRLKLVLIVLLVTLLFGGGAVAAYMMKPEASDDQATTQAEENSESEDTTDENVAEETPVDTDTSAPGEKVEAKALDDYKAACATGGLVTNATAYAGVSPHPIVVFEKGSDDKFALSIVSFKDKTWSADPAKLNSGQLVACISRKTASEVKIKSCPITDSVTKVTANVDFYSTKYTVDVYEAKTGKKVSSFENSSISTTCPTNAVYNKADPKIYAGFDLVALEASLKDSVTKVF